MTDPVPLHTPDRQSPRHPELVSGSISPLGAEVAAEEWMLKQVQHDDFLDVRQRFEAQPYGEIMPVGILAEDEVDFPLAMPALELFLARDRGFHGAEQFIPDETMNFVPAGEAGCGCVPMLPQSSHEVAGHPDVECSIRFASEDIDAMAALDVHGVEIGEAWMLKQVQHDGIKGCSSHDRP